MSDPDQGQDRPTLGPSLRALAKEWAKVAEAAVELRSQGKLTATVIAFTPPPVSMDALLRSASRQARRGMDARADGEHDAAALHLGTMLEHLAKAFLVHHHPVLVLERNFDFNALLKLIGQGHRVPPGHTVRTVSFDEALKRIGLMLGPAKDDEWSERYKPVITARNGAAHLGDEPDDADAVARLAVLGASQLLPHMSRSLADLFGEHESAAVALIDEQVTAVARAVLLKLSYARSEYRRRYGSLTADELRVALSPINVRRALLDTDDGFGHECPACGHDGILSGPTYMDVESAADLLKPDYDPLAHLPVIVLSPTRFDCPVCQLHLAGRDELAEAKLNSLLELRPATEEDAERHYATTWEVVENDETTDGMS